METNEEDESPEDRALGDMVTDEMLGRYYMDPLATQKIVHQAIARKEQVSQSDGVFRSLYACLSVCLSICLSVCLSVFYISLRLNTSLSVCLFNAKIVVLYRTH